MTDQFNLDNSDIRKLQNFYEKAPKVFEKMSSNVLNSMAFADRLGNMREVGRDMIIRNPKLLKSIMRFQMSKPSQPITQQRSISGSVEKPRHDAFAAVEKGTGVRITQFTDAGRGGSNTDKARKEAKAAKNASEESQQPSDYGLSENNIKKFFQRVATQKAAGKLGRRKAFYLAKKYKGMSRGVYKFVGGKTGSFPAKGGGKIKSTLVGAKPKRLSTPKSAVKPAAIHWKEKATKKTITPAFIKKAWTNAGNRVMKKEIERKFKGR